MKVLDFPQGSEEWFAARCGKVTASRVSDVMAQGRSGPSVTRETYMAELIAEVLSGKPVKSWDGNADTERGVMLEPEARSEYELASGNMVRQTGLVLHPRIERVAASPDGLVGDDGGLELKCPKPHVHLKYLMAGKPPPAYVPQMTLQAMCMERSWIDFASYCPDFPEEYRLFVVRHTPDLAYIKEVEAAIEAFLSEMDAKLQKLRSMR